MIIYPAKYAHLGDLINILQIHADSEQICIDKICPCGCEQNTFDLLTDVVSFFDRNIEVHPIILPNAVKVYPIWAQNLKNPSGTLRYYNKPYVKAKELPLQQNHIACQFDYRSKNTPWFKGISDLSQIIKRFKKKLVNIGDKHIEGIKNCVDYTLKEKFHILASSSMYIGIDSGLSHLALMTNTKCYICHENRCPWFFYPKDPIFINMKIKEELSLLLDNDRILLQ
jgi:hypothetical protein